MRKDNVSVKNVKTTNIRTGEVKQSKVQTTTLDERPSLWNLQAFAIVFLFILLSTTINVYSVNNDNLTWVDSNGDFKLDSYNHSMINLDTDLVELNNQTLNEVFLDGNLLDDFSSLTTDGAIKTIVDDVVLVTWDNSSSYITLRDSSVQVYDNHKYYVVTTIKNPDDSADVQIRFNTLVNVYNHSASDVFVTKTGITTNVYGDSNYYARIILSSPPYNDYVMFVKTFKILDLTSLGIDNLTLSEIDNYYDLYLSLQENRIEAYKQLGNEPISQWQNLTQMLTNTIDDILVPLQDANDWIKKFMNGLFS